MKIKTYFIFIQALQKLLSPAKNRGPPPKRHSAPPKRHSASCKGRTGRRRSCAQRLLGF